MNKLQELRNKANLKEEGFTLIELMIVVVIIGILAAIAIPIFANQQQAAADAAMKTDLKTIALAQQTYITKNPNATGTGNPDELNKLVPKLSQNAITETWANAKGYCVVGASKAATSSDAKFYWYDSALGGLQKGSPAAGGACDVPANERNSSIWRVTSNTNSEKWAKIVYS